VHALRHVRAAALRHAQLGEGKCLFAGCKGADKPAGELLTRAILAIMLHAHAWWLGPTVTQRTIVRMLCQR
jgi:hypothetical protein